MRVRCSLMPGAIREYEVADGSTVNDVLARAGHTPEGFEITRNGETTSLDSRLSEGDSVILSRKVKGN